MMLASQEREKRKAQEERSELQQILQHVQGRCREKIRVGNHDVESLGPPFLSYRPRRRSMRRWWLWPTSWRAS